jgi:hypothetical protein
MIFRYHACVILVLCASHVANCQEAGEHPFSGRVVDASAKPVPGAIVRMLAMETTGLGLGDAVDQATKTDAQGRFQLAVPKSWLRMSITGRQELGIIAVHEGRMAGILIARTSLPPNAGLELDLPAPSETVIVVRSPDGRPVHGAVVTINALQVDQINPDLTEKGARGYAGPIKKSKNGYVVSRNIFFLPDGLRRVAGKTDDMGRVRVADLARTQIAGVTVESAEFGEQTVLWRGQEMSPNWPGKITLQPVGRIRGQVSGAPKSVASRAVTIATYTEINHQMYRGRATVRTDAEGKFDLPKIAVGSIDTLVNFDPKAPDRAVGTKKPLQVKADATVDLKVDLKPTVPLVGVVRDRQGKPVADARVTLFSSDLRVETATSVKGEFKLEPTSGEPFWVDVRHPDFRAHGALYNKDPAQLDQVLTRLSEPTEKRTPRAILVTPERQKLLQNVLAPFKQQLLKTANQDEDEKYWDGVVLAKVDPEFLLEYLSKNPLKGAMEHDNVLLVAVKEWALRRPDDVEEMIGKLQVSYNKALALCEIADGLPDKSRARKLDFLAEALVAARAEKSPEFRTLVLGYVGRRLFDLGEKDRATAVLREGAKLAAGLPTTAWAGFARGSFATDLALIDLPAGLALVKDLKDPSAYWRHHRNIANRIAGTQPAEAVKVLDRIPRPRSHEYNQRDLYAIRVCYRMAGVDLPRSLALADTIIDVPSRAQALGVIAQAVSRTDPKTATDLLRRAYTLLEAGAATEDDPLRLLSPLRAGSVAAVLIFNAAEIDPTLVDECMWRAVALRRRPTEDRQKVWYYLTTNNALAMTVARYDAKLADLLLPAPSAQFEPREGPLAQFLVHPQRTVLAAARSSSPAAARELRALIGYIGTEENQLPRLIHRTLGIWRIDDAYFD